MTGALLIVGTGRYATGGLLTWSAWQALHRADEVYLAPGAGGHWELVLRDAGLNPVRADSPAAGPLLGRVLDGAVVAWFAGPDGDPDLTRALTTDLLARGARGDPMPELEMVLGSWDEPGAAFLDLVEVMDRLRSPGGCPWDAEQTHESLLPYLVEETYEFVDAVESGDRAHIVEELGDVLMQVVFHARVGTEHEDAFDIDDVAAGISAKLLRRHPHVFGESDAATPAEVEAQWDAIKAAEKEGAGLLDGVPVSMPALPRAVKVQRRLQRAGLSSDVVLPADPTPEQWHGRQLWQLVTRCRQDGVDPEAALRAAIRLVIAGPGDGPGSGGDEVGGVSVHDPGETGDVGPRIEHP